MQGYYKLVSSNEITIYKVPTTAYHGERMIACSFYKVVKWSLQNQPLEIGS